MAVPILTEAVRLFAKFERVSSEENSEFFEPKLLKEQIRSLRGEFFFTKPGTQDSKDLLDQLEQAMQRMLFNDGVENTVSYACEQFQSATINSIIDLHYKDAANVFKEIMALVPVTNSAAILELDDVGALERISAMLDDFSHVSEVGLSKDTVDLLVGLDQEIDRKLDSLRLA